MSESRSLFSGLTPKHWIVFIALVSFVIVLGVMANRNEVVKNADNSESLPFHGKEYTVFQKGALFYLVDENNTLITPEGYHRLFVMEDKIYGVIGAQKEWVVDSEGQTNPNTILR